MWLRWLLGSLLESQLAATFMAIVIESAAVLSLSFWWYNNVTAIVATVFLLSCLVYLERPAGAGPQSSYVSSLALPVPDEAQRRWLADSRRSHSAGPCHAQ